MPDMLRRFARRTLAAGLALCLGLAFIPLGCGGSRGVEAGAHGGGGLSIPDATVSELRACAEKSKARLRETTYAFQFAVEVTEDGHAGRVKLKDSSPGDGEMESCMTGVLEDMPVPPAAVQMLTSPAEASVSPQSRALIGNPLAAVMVVIELAPIMVVAAGATIVVGVAIYASDEIIETVRRKSRIKAKCLDMFVECDSRGPPCFSSMCAICQENCIKGAPYKFSQCVPCGFR
jgi:hypothetical protein